MCRLSVERQEREEVAHLAAGKTGQTLAIAFEVERPKKSDAKCAHLRLPVSANRPRMSLRRHRCICDRRSSAPAVGPVRLALRSLWFRSCWSNPRDKTAN